MTHLCHPGRTIEVSTVARYNDPPVSLRSYYRGVYSSQVQWPTCLTQVVLLRCLQQPATMTHLSHSGRTIEVSTAASYNDLPVSLRSYWRPSMIRPRTQPSNVTGSSSTAVTATADRSGRPPEGKHVNYSVISVTLSVFVCVALGRCCLFVYYF